LSELGRDGVCQLGAFSWGPAAGWPFLPRVTAGRAVLSLARWRLSKADLGEVGVVAGLGPDSPRFQERLDQWREHWQVPTRVAIAAGDRLLALDLDRATDLAEVRRALAASRGAVTLTELYPDAPGLWLTDTSGHGFAAELVIPLIRRAVELPAPVRPSGPGMVVDLRPPGSDWLFVKLYTGTDLEDDLLVGPIRELVEKAVAVGVRNWFFLRYDDPDRHIRLRFRSSPDLLLSAVLPRVAAWASDLMSDGLLRRFAIDTYERELDRFGGPAGTDAVEGYFAEDSAATLGLLAARTAPGTVALDPISLGVLTVDSMLAGFGLDLAARAAWCADRGGPRRESGADYRAFKGQLRNMLSTPGDPGSPLDADTVEAVRARLHRATRELRADLDRLTDRGHLTTTPADIMASLTHLHLNRLIAADRATERRVYGLLGRLCAGLAASSGQPTQRPSATTSDPGRPTAG
jgi:thiopeptide-type bacteriocin biosynthesis protein